VEDCIKIINSLNYLNYCIFDANKFNMTNSPKFGVIGGGSWATAIVKMLTENLDTINWYMRSKTAIEHIRTQDHNPNYLSSVEFDVIKVI